MPDIRSCESEACPDWEFLVNGIRNKDGAAMERFCEVLKVSLSSLVRRQLLHEEDAQECVGQCLFLALKGIQEGRLLDPQKTPAYVRGVLRNLLRKAIRNRIAARGRRTDHSVESIAGTMTNPEQDCILRERQILARRMMDGLRPVEREVLRRFYLEGESAEKIQRDLEITSTQFRLMKTRAKARLAMLTGRLTEPRKHFGKGLAPVDSRQGLSSSGMKTNRLKTVGAAA